MASAHAKIQAVVDLSSNDALPSRAAIDNAEGSLLSSLPATGLGEEVVEAHLLTDLVPAFNGPKTSANYYGFVTGGVFPVAEFADHLVTAFDQNVQVHLPEQSISTAVEDRALRALVELLDLGEGWHGRTFTTGATERISWAWHAGGRQSFRSVLPRVTQESGSWASWWRA